jgi:hypothetical protein
VSLIVAAAAARAARGQGKSTYERRTFPRPRRRRSAVGTFTGIGHTLLALAVISRSRRARPGASGEERGIGSTSSVRGYTAGRTGVLLLSRPRPAGESRRSASRDGLDKSLQAPRQRVRRLTLWRSCVRKRGCALAGRKRTVDEAEFASIDMTARGALGRAAGSQKATNRRIDCRFRHSFASSPYSFSSHFSSLLPSSKPTGVEHGLRDHRGAHHSGSISCRSYTHTR